MNESDIKRIAGKRGYGIVGTISSGIRKGSIASQIDGSGEIDNLEPDSLDASLQAEKLQISYSGKPEIRITFYRRRLADHSRAISEKALVDCLQYAGLIEGDSEKEIRLTYVEQKKVESDEEERTEIELIYEEVDYDNLWKQAKQNKAR